MRINVAIPETRVSAPILDAALESVTRLDESLIRDGAAPTFAEGVKAGVRWKPEPPGAEHFDHAAHVFERKWGDCDDLAPWHAATLRATGKDEGATAVVKRSGPNRWHAVVRRSDGTIEDPSKAAGMGQGGVVGGFGAALPLMAPPAVHSVGGVGAYLMRPQIAMRPVYGGFQARADLPWHWRTHTMRDNPTPADFAMTALHTAPLAATALTGAIDGVCVLGEEGGFATGDDLRRLAAISGLCHGIHRADLARVYGEQVVNSAEQIVGSFWKGLKKIASPVAKLARQAVKFVPGVGPVIDTGLNIAEQAQAAARKAGIRVPGDAPMPGGAAVERGKVAWPPRGIHATFF